MSNESQINFERSRRNQPRCRFAQHDASEARPYIYVMRQLASFTDRSRLRDSHPYSRHRASGPPKPGRRSIELLRWLWRHAPTLFPFKSKISTEFMLALDAYNRPLFESMAKSSKPYGPPHSGTVHFVRNFPFESNTCIRLLRGSAT